MSAELLNKTEIIKERGRMLSLARSFFAERGVVEVDTPHLANGVIVDSYIDLIPATFRGHQTCYLNSSPEMYMKQLLSSGMGDIYQLGHVFRDGELGRKHNPEFMMCEWYRIGFTYDQIIDETLEFIQAIVGSYPVKRISYRDSFLIYTQVDPYTATPDELRAVLQKHGFEPMQTDSADELAQQILADIIEPYFNIPEYIVLTHFPPSMASLAKVVEHEGHPVAERFEIYFRGLELCNGFNELSDPSEQLDRFKYENQKRLQANKPELPISIPFIHSLANLPPCAGVAVGFDRLLMLKFGAASISDVLPFTWS